MEMITILKLTVLLTTVIVMSGCSIMGGMSDRYSDGEWIWLEDEKDLLNSDADAYTIIERGETGCEVLRKRARHVPRDLDLKDVATRMKNTMNKADGVGLAGPQVGFSLRIAVLMLDFTKGAPYTIFVRNPAIVERSDESIDSYEGCLSIPGKGGKVKRHNWIKVEYIDEMNETVVAAFDGMNAVVWQHELDHLDGILYVDKLIGDLLPDDEMRRRRIEEEAKREKVENE